MIFELEKVFNEASFPEVTFVEPKEYAFVKSSFKSEGKHVTISGPSGTGKTSLVVHGFRDLGINSSNILWINARQYSQHDSLFHALGEELHIEPTFNEITAYLQLIHFIVIDDFHHLRASARLELAQNLKLWHEKKVRFIIVGIASSAYDLYGVDTELGIRNDPFELKTQDISFTTKLIQLGQDALNIKLTEQLTEDICKASNGVPSIIQVICKNCCIQAGIEQTHLGERVTIDYRLSEIREAVLRVFHGKYFEKVVGLAKGKQQARSVHNTYFDIVKKIASDQRSEIPIEFLYHNIVGIIEDSKKRSKKATSFYNCLNNLSDVITEKGLGETILYKKGGKFISIEDPSFRFYLNLLNIEDVKSKIHLRSDEYPYDVALSFAGNIRPVVEELVRSFQNRGLSVFYDFDQQALLWGQDLRVRLSEVYANEALFMLVFLSHAYPERDWTDFELAIGKEAATKRTEEYLLPILVDDVKIVGIKETISRINLRDRTPDQVADLLAEKVQSRSS